MWGNVCLVLSKCENWTFLQEISQATYLSGGLIFFSVSVMDKGKKVQVRKDMDVNEYERLSNFTDQMVFLQA